MLFVIECPVYGWCSMPLAWLLFRASLQQQHPALGWPFSDKPCIHAFIAATRPCLYHWMCQAQFSWLPYLELP